MKPIADDCGTILGEIQRAIKTKRGESGGRTGNVITAREVNASTSLEVSERVDAVLLNAGHGAKGVLIRRLGGRKKGGRGVYSTGLILHTFVTVMCVISGAGVLPVFALSMISIRDRSWKS